MAPSEAKTKPDTVGLLGDGDDIELLEAIESSFQIEFGEAAAKCFTVGDLYETLLGLVPTSSVPGLCATSMAFYRVRSTLCRVAVQDGPIKPSTRLSGLTTLSPRRLNARLEQDHGLARLPLRLSVLGGIGLAMLLSGVVGGVMVVALPLLWPILLLIPIGFAMVRLDEGAYRDMTVGDLARDVARRNFSHFASGGADTRPAALWRTLCELVAEETGTTPVTAQTRLFA